MITSRTAPSIHHGRVDVEHAEAVLGHRLASFLEAGTQDLPHDITERLRFARQQALEKATHATIKVPQSQPQVAQNIMIHHDGSASLGGPDVSWLWKTVFSVLPLIVLVAGLTGIQVFKESEQISAVAEVDVNLLSDALPPVAYSDPGFAEFVKEATVYTPKSQAESVQQ